MTLSPVLARRALLAVGLVALLEIVLGWRAYSDLVGEDDWSKAHEAIAAVPADEPIYLATEWLGPRARMELPRMRGLDEIGRPDLRGHPVFHVLGIGKDAWSDRLHADLEGAAMPRRTGRLELGSLSLTTYEQRTPSRALASWLDLGLDLDVRTDIGACRGRNPWRCGETLVQRSVAEIDYRPRRCILVDVADGRTAILTARDMPTGNILRGHLGFHDYNRRLRSDAPVTLTVRIDGEAAGRWVVTDEQGWWPFAVPTSNGRHEVSLELTVAVRGTWSHDGPRPNEPRTACLELRALEEPEP
jgi:hypothetical protein